MKRIVAFGLLIVTMLNAQGQTWDEWFKQRKTQRKYMLKQIEALQVYIGYAKNGYDIASKGLNTIRQIKDGDFNLHREFFGSLSLVNPAIKKYKKVADIIAIQVRIVKNAKQVTEVIRATGQFTADEITYCTTIFSGLLEDCFDTINELFLIIAPDHLQMKDDERIQRIDLLYTKVQDTYSFSEDFRNSLGVLALQRANEKIDIEYSKIINGLR